MSIFLLYELAFIATLAWLMAQAEAEAARQEHARQVTEKASRLMLDMYDTGDAVGRYARSLEFGPTDSAKASKEEVPALIDWLKEAFKDNPPAQSLLQKIEREIAACLPLITDIQGQSSNLANAQERQAWNMKKEAMQPMVNQLVKDIPALIAISRELEKDAPEQERLKRQITEKVLLVGMLMNLLVVFSIAYLFTSRITARLDLLTQNTARLKDGRDLKPLLDGNDEIAAVDRVFHDTAATLRQEMKVLKASEARVRTLIETLPIGIVLLDENGTIELVNTTFETTFKYATHQVLGKRLGKLFVPGQAVVEGAPHSQQSRAAFGQNLELTALSKDGQSIAVDFMMVALELEGESKTLAMIMDASEKYKIKKMRQSFVFMVRSELKEPLTKVSSFLTKLGNGSLGMLSPEGAGTTLSMQQNIERLIVLLNDLFDLEKLESGKIEIDPAPVQLGVIFERSINAVAMFAQKHHVQLHVPSCQLELYADTNRLVQVLVNLLSNAIKFSPPNAVVTIAVRQSSTQVEIGVIDQGRGIPASELEAVFEAYRQVEAGDAKKKGGTGLGLTICKSIVEAHGGQIGVNSEEGKGSVFWFRLPRPSKEGR